MTTKLTATLPKVTSANGLAVAGHELVSDPLQTRLIVALIDVKKVTRNLDDDTDDSTVRILRVELLKGEDANAAGRLLQRAFELRTGQTVLPLDLEDDLRGVRIDRKTGEVLG